MSEPAKPKKELEEAVKETNSLLALLAGDSSEDILEAESEEETE